MDPRRPEIDPRRNFRVVTPVRVEPRRPRDWEIPLDTWPRKIIAILIILAISGALIYHTWWLFLAAWITRNKTMDPVIYERAVQYDPANADYHFLLAQIYNYSTSYLDLERARLQYEQAVKYNPYRSQYWLELSKLYEQEGNIERARFAMTKTLENDPNFAQMHWAAANLYVRLADQKAADYELRRSADLDVNYTVQVLDLVWAVYADPDFIMSTHIPNTKDASLLALDYFHEHDSPHGAELAWNRLKGFETRPQDRFHYIDYLIARNQPHEAWKVFSAGLETGGSLFYNAGFESEPLNGGFDWRFSSTDDAEIRRDTTTVKDGLDSLMITFSGKQNPDFHEPTHLLPVEKGKKYVVKFWMKTDSISTNEGVYFTVDGQSSEKQLGTTYWQEFTIPFTATSDLVDAALRRDSSKKFDNLLKGKVWLDAFSLTALQ